MPRNRKVFGRRRFTCNEVEWRVEMRCDRITFRQKFKRRVESLSFADALATALGQKLLTLK